MTLMPQDFVNTWKRATARSLAHQPCDDAEGICPDKLETES